jgi:hypothetical protein
MSHCKESDARGWFCRFTSLFFIIVVLISNNVRGLNSKEMSVVTEVSLFIDIYLNDLHSVWVLLSMNFEEIIPYHLYAYY